MVIQLGVTFVFEISYINNRLVTSTTSMYWDIIGFQLHNLRLYQVIMHLVTMAFSIQAI